ncbi:MAG: ABC transporter substrate-binding protein [Frankia sp.]
MLSSDYFIALGRSISTWGDYVSAHGGHRAALLYSVLDSGSQIIFSQYSASLKAAGITVDPIAVDLKATSPPSVAAQIARNHDDVLTGSVDTGLFAQIAQATNQASPGQLKVILSPIGYDKTFLAVFGKSLPGLSTVVTYTPFEEHTGPIQKFLAAMTAYSPEVQPAENEIAIAGWLDTDLTLTGLAAAGPCPTRATFVTGLRNITRYNAGGLLVTPVNLKTNFGQLNLCYTFVKIAPTGTSWQVDKPAPRCGHPLQ